jgi:hypothetical protein
MSSRKLNPSEHEGQRVIATDRRFLIKNGRRVWLDHPPAHIIPDLLRHV